LNSRTNPRKKRLEGKQSQAEGVASRGTVRIARRPGFYKVSDRFLGTGKQTQKTMG